MIKLENFTTKGESLPIHQAQIVIIYWLVRTAFYCYSVITAVRGCILIFKWEGNGDTGLVKPYIIKKTNYFYPCWAYKGSFTKNCLAYIAYKNM